jgi:hypothetical protein
LVEKLEGPVREQLVVYFDLLDGMEWDKCEEHFEKKICDRYRKYFKNGRVTGEAEDACRAKITVWVEETGILGLDVELSSLPQGKSTEVVLQVTIDNESETFFVDSNSLFHVERQKKKEKKPTNMSKYGHSRQGPFMSKAEAKFNISENFYPVTKSISLIDDDSYLIVSPTRP